MGQFEPHLRPPWAPLASPSTSSAKWAGHAQWAGSVLGVQLGSLRLCCPGSPLPPPVRGWARGARALHPTPGSLGLVFPAGLLADIQAGVRRPGAPPERAGGARAKALGSDGGVLGVRLPPRRVSRPREACLPNRGSQIRGRVTRNQVSQPRRRAGGRVSPLSWAGGKGGPRGGGRRKSDTSAVFPRPSPAEASRPASRLARLGGGSRVRPGEDAGRTWGLGPGPRTRRAAAHPRGPRAQV